MLETKSQGVNCEVLIFRCKIYPQCALWAVLHCLFCFQDACLDGIDVKPVYMVRVLKIIERDEDSGKVKPLDELSLAKRY